jgi:hypothetical protein
MVAHAHGHYASLCSRVFLPSHRNRALGQTNRFSWFPDQAGWHKSCDLVVPEGLHLLFLPSHSPELQPAERWWPLSNEPLANRVFSSRGSSCKTFKQSAATGFKLILTSFVGGPPFMGGLL